MELVVSAIAAVVRSALIASTDAIMPIGRLQIKEKRALPPRFRRRTQDKAGSDNTEERCGGVYLGGPRRISEDDGEKRPPIYKAAIRLRRWLPRGLGASEDPSLLHPHGPPNIIGAEGGS